METIDRTNLRALTADEQKKYGLSCGIEVIDPIQTGGIPWNSNISPGFTICTVNGQPVTDLFVLTQQLRGPSGVWVSGIYPDGTHDAYFIH